MLTCIDASEGLRTIESNSIPLTVTSPPYDALRTYGGRGNVFQFEDIAEQLYRVTMPHGVVCWNVQDQIKKWSESGTSCYQKLYFKKIGFTLYNTLVVESPSDHRAGISGHRYGPALQFVFVLTKGGRPRAFHQIRDQLGKYRHAANPRNVGTRNRAGEMVGYRFIVPKRFWRPRTNIWRYGITTKDKEALHAAHGALMAEGLAEDLILSWSNPGDVVLDPMTGLGTTWKMATIQHRRFLGFEIVSEYCEIARRRVERFAA